jgi:hypothetical protein
MLKTAMFNRPMGELAEADNQTVFAHLAERVTTICRRKFPAPHDDNVEAMHLIIDELAYTCRPELTANQWFNAVSNRLGVDFRNQEKSSRFDTVDAFRPAPNLRVIHGADGRGPRFARR